MCGGVLVGNGELTIAPRIDAPSPQPARARVGFVYGSPESFDSLGVIHRRMVPVNKPKNKPKVQES
jgi:hypothetical protein